MNKNFLITLFLAFSKNEATFINNNNQFVQEELNEEDINKNPEAEADSDKDDK